MGRLNRSSLPFIGLMITSGILSATGCTIDPYGLPSPGTSTSSSSGGGEGGMGGTGGMGGAGGMMVCKPGTKMPCYTGSVETANVGKCKPGTQTCLADGTGYDVCVGDVLPMPEDCLAVGDEDCDGYTDLEDSECACTEAGAATVCTTMDPGVCAAGMGICSDDGRSITNCAPVNAPSPENCANNLDDDCDGNVAPACSGDLQWSFVPNAQMSTTKDDLIFSVAAISGDGYVMAGMVDGTLGADLYGITTGTIYIAKLDNAGVVQWEKRYAPTNLGTARGVDVDMLGNIYVVGEFDGTVKFDGTNDEVSASRDIFVLKLSSAGQYVWHKKLGTTNNQAAFDVAVDADGSFYITGFATNDAFSFGMGGATFDPDAADVYIAKFDADGNHKWSEMFSSAGAQFGRGVEITKDGDVILVGNTDNNTTLGGMTHPKGGGRDVFVARYAKGDGAYLWSQLYGIDGEQVVRGVGIDHDGHVLITGAFSGNILWDANTTSTAVGGLNLYMAKLDVKNGTHLQHLQLGKTLNTVGAAVSTDNVGNLTLTGNFNGTMDIGGQTYSTGTNLDDVFQVKLKAGDWAPLWVKTYGKAGNQYAYDLVANGDGTSLVAGGFYTEFEAPPNAIVPSAGGADIFAVLAKP